MKINAGLLLITILLCPFKIFSQQTGALHVVVENITNTGGIMQLAIYSDKESFLKEPYAVKSVPVNDDSTTTITFTELPVGAYGISIFHDLNENITLDTNFIGIPREPFGFSNNAMGAFGPPGFEKASVKVSLSEQTTVIRLKSF